MKIATLVMAWFLFGASHKVIGPDKKPLPGSPGGPTLSNKNMTPPDPPYRLLLQIADSIEVQQSRQRDKLNGTVENPHVRWSKISDTFYSFELEGMTVGVTWFPPGIRHIELLKGQSQHLPQRMYGSLVIFAAKLNCTNAFWFQYVGRDDTFVTNTSNAPIRKRLTPEIDGGAPYGIQMQTGQGSTFMHDFAGTQGLLRASEKEIAVDAIQQYAKDGRISAKGITQLTARYRFWSYAVCLEPSYSVAGHFEWGYTTHLDAIKEPHIKTDSNPVRWIQNF